MGVKVSAVAVECEHEEEFGIHPRRGDTGGGEAVDGGSEGVTQQHKVRRSEVRSKKQENQNAEVRTQKWNWGLASFDPALQFAVCSSQFSVCILTSYV